MSVLFKNNVTATLAAGISDTATTIVVSSGQGARFPSITAGQFFYATLYDSSNNVEIVKVTARTTDTLTVVRGFDGSTAHSYLAGDNIAMRLVAAALTDIQAYTPSGNIAATTIVGAIAELDSEKAGLATNNTFSGVNAFSSTSNTFNGTFTGNVTGNVTGNADTATSATKVANTGGWSITPTGTKLYFSYNGANVASLDSSGNFIVLGSETAGGTP